VLQSQGHQLDQRITFLSDGGDTVRGLQLYLNLHAEHILDWFHVAMRLTVLQQTAKGLPEKTLDEETDYPLRDPTMRELERLKWFLWHGNVYKALQVIECVEMDLDAAVANISFTNLTMRDRHSPDCAQENRFRRPENQWCLRQPSEKATIAGVQDW
jgi:hypothetical protein